MDICIFSAFPFQITIYTLSFTIDTNGIDSFVTHHFAYFIVLDMVPIYLSFYSDRDSNWSTAYYLHAALHQYVFI